MKIPDWPHYTKECIDKVSEVIKSGKVNYWTGNEGLIFEQEFAKFANCKYSIALSNGTVALEAAYNSLQLSEGDEFITTPRTYIATAMAGYKLGAVPIFADVDIESGCITAESIDKCISQKTKLISVVHLGGWPADMISIIDLAKSRNIHVVEDCSQAHGATISGESVGSFGDVSTWSFCQDKIISTIGEGGMVTTNDENLWQNIWSYKDHGKSYNLVFNKNHPPGYRWLHNNIGTNIRLTETQSAVGRLQLKELESWRTIRNRNAQTLIKKLSNLSCLRIPQPISKFRHAWYKFYCYLDINSLSSDWDRNRIIQEINFLGYPAFHGGCGEIYLEKSFKKNISHNYERKPNAKILSETSLMFLVHPTIDEDSMNSYAKVIKEVLLKAIA